MEFILKKQKRNKKKETKQVSFFNLNYLCIKIEAINMLLPYLNENLIEAGCDEAGRGCLAGAVYAAAVILPKDFKNELLNDSKQLTEKQRYALREVIEKEAVDGGICHSGGHDGVQCGQRRSGSALPQSCAAGERTLGAEPAQRRTKQQHGAVIH